jgi:hypothetical protein
MSRRMYSVPYSGTYAHREHRTKDGRKKGYRTIRHHHLRKIRKIEKIRIKELEDEEKEIKH